MPALQIPRGSRTPTSSGSRSGSASSRGTSGSSTSSRSGGGDSSSSSRGTGAVPRGSYGSDRGYGGGTSSTYGSRDRGNRPRTGIATERPEGYYGYPSDNIGYYPGDVFSPWGRWYPWYGYGYGYGYLTFDPWRYGSSRYSLWRYGSWYNPYDPSCYAGSYACGAYYGGGGGGDDVDDDLETGSVRLRVSPASAEVFVDGALVGIVDDFNGLSDHLRLTTGTHLVEIKAAGYETYVPQIQIAVGKTTTVRGSLKKVQ